MYFQHSKYSIFDTKAPTMVLVAQAVFLLGPLLLLIAGGIAYSIYADCRDRGTEAPSNNYGGGYGDPYGGGYRGTTRSRRPGRSSQAPGIASAATKGAVEGA